MTTTRKPSRRMRRVDAVVCSLYENGSQTALAGAEAADVCVIGAGLTGISCALELASRGYRVVVLEANRIGWGASGRSGGQMIYGYSCGEEAIEKLVGPADAKALWDMSLEGMELIRERVRKHEISCDLTSGHLHAAIKPSASLSKG